MRGTGRARGLRRSISNIIGAIILVAITIVGGLMVYNYFSKSMTSFMSLGSSVIVTASETSTSTNESIIYIKVTNNEGSTINVTAIYLIGPNGNVVRLGQGILVAAEADIIGATVPPTRSLEGIYVVRGYYTGVYIQYEANGATYYTQPVSLG